MARMNDWDEPGTDEPAGPQYTLVRFHEPVPAEVIDADEIGQMNPAIHPGALAGILQLETGRVFPFPTFEDAQDAFPEFAGARDPGDVRFAWEPHYSSEYAVEEVI